MHGSVLVALVSGAAVASAGGAVLDQVSPYTNTSFNMLTSDMNWQQEVVVGLSGPLVQVDVYVTQAGSCTFYINTGAPWQGDPPDYSTTFVASGTGWQSIGVASAGLSFLPGDRFVLGFIGQNTLLNLGGSWLPPGGEYVPGNLYLNGASFATGAYDVAFRTYVPGPGTLALCAVGILAGLRRRR